MMTNTKQQKILLGLGVHELTSLVEESGQPQYRAQQLFEAIYRQRVGSAEQISTLSQEFRAALLQKGFSVGLPTIDKKFVSVDGTVRYLVTFAAGESVGQIIAVLNEQHVSPPGDRVNLVFMGMGEPFLNYENFMKAVRLLVEGVGIPESRMTVSTAGIVPRIHDLGKETVRPKLAISLNASNDVLRTALMPINRKWNLEMLVQAARDFPLRSR